jgi:hypothetical protein
MIRMGCEYQLTDGGRGEGMLVVKVKLVMLDR